MGAIDPLAIVFIDISAIKPQDMSSFEASETIEEGILDTLVAKMEAFISLAIFFTDTSAVL